MSVFGQYAPYDLSEGDWDSRRGDVERQFVDLISRFAPDFADCLDECEVLGPPDIESRIGLTGGNIFQGEVTPDQMWEGQAAGADAGPRPLPLRRRDPSGGERDRAQRPQRRRRDARRPGRGRRFRRPGHLDFSHGGGNTGADPRSRLRPDRGGGDRRRQDRPGRDAGRRLDRARPPLLLDQGGAARAGAPALLRAGRGRALRRRGGGGRNRDDEARRRDRGVPAPGGTARAGLGPLGRALAAGGPRPRRSDRSPPSSTSATASGSRG